MVGNNRGEYTVKAEHHMDSQCDNKDVCEMDVCNSPFKTRLTIMQGRGANVYINIRLALYEFWFAPASAILVHEFNVRMCRTKFKAQFLPRNV